MAIALVVKGTAQSSDTNSVTSSGIDTTGANLLVVAVSWYAGNGVESVTVSDSNSNTWTSLTKATNVSSGGNQRLQFFYAKNATVGASHTFTASGTAFYPAVHISAWSGADTSSPFDQESVSSVQNLATIQPGSITPSAVNELVVTAQAHTNSIGTPMTIDSGFSSPDEVDRISTSLEISWAYIIETSIVAKNPTWSTPAAGTTDMVAAIASFKVSSGGGAVLGSNFYRHVAGIGA